VRTNEHGQPVGDPVPSWTAPPAPGPVVLEGRWTRLEPLSTAHTTDLCAATCGEGRDRLWTYLPAEMPRSRTAFEEYVETRIAWPDNLSLVVVPRGRGPEGIASLMRADPANGTVEVGHILFGEPLQRTTAATEAIWLLARHVFGLGYRRFEWKCDSLNAPSRSAATRFGFTFEGVFRQALVTKGRNRDTAWYSITDEEWRRLAPAYDRWLDPANFADPERGLGQRVSLRGLTASVAGPSPRSVSEAGTAVPRSGTTGTLS
jgi:RimJ/RimL family protein N-acetyltransferase